MNRASSGSVHCTVGVSSEPSKGVFRGGNFLSLIIVGEVIWWGLSRLTSLHARRRGARMKMRKKRIKVVSAVCRPKGVTAQRLVLRALF